VGKNKSRKAKSLYAVQENQLAIQQDIPKLPIQLQALYPSLKQLLSINPLYTSQFPNHALKGDLANYRALEVDWDDSAYRLVYRVVDSPFPKTVRIISFDEHDPAYDSAKERLRASKSK
jgi:mRNA-degrading endonuclease YafQ of YafQ-DinJ toxin-antitoxin module